MNKRLCERHEGQGLVEYALILVFVGIVVLMVLSLLGPQVGNVFSQVVEGLGGVQVNALMDPTQDDATVTSVSLRDRVGNVVILNVAVSEDTPIVLSDSQGNGSVTRNCDDRCVPNITVGGSSGGRITVTAPGNSMTISYPPSS